MDRGVCTDVVIRALRQLNFDLQKEVHEDMKKNFSAYPSRKNWGLKRTDRNIDHRRVPNQEVYFKRRGWSKPVTKNPADYLPGDIVTCLIGDSIPHVMIVSDRKSEAGTPLCFHNIGMGTEEEDCLFDFTTTGHYIVLVGTEDGLLRVNDPNSYANSEKLWTYEQLESQFRNLWVVE